MFILFFYLMLIMLGIAVVVVLPAGLFWLPFKISSLIREKKYILVIAIIIAILFVLILGALFLYEIVVVLLVVFFVMILFSFLILFINLVIVVLLAIHLIKDIFYKKKLSNAKRIAIGMLMAIYLSEIVGIIYFFVTIASRKYGWNL